MSTVVITEKMMDYATRLASDWMNQNPDWKPGEDSSLMEDDWRYHHPYDVNLYVDGGVLRVTAYKLVLDDCDHWVIDPSDFVTIVTIDKNTNNK